MQIIFHLSRQLAIHIFEGYVLSVTGQGYVRPTLLLSFCLSLSIFIICQNPPKISLHGKVKYIASTKATKLSKVVYERQLAQLSLSSNIFFDIRVFFLELQCVVGNFKGLSHLLSPNSFKSAIQIKMSGVVLSCLVTIWLVLTK